MYVLDVVLDDELIRLESEECLCCGLIVCEGGLVDCLDDTM
jgi:hypothetical protein